MFYCNFFKMKNPKCLIFKTNLFERYPKEPPGDWGYATLVGAAGLFYLPAKPVPPTGGAPTKKPSVHQHTGRVWGRFSVRRSISFHKHSLYRKKFNFKLNFININKNWIHSEKSFLRKMFKLHFSNSLSHKKLRTLNFRIKNTILIFLE